MYVPLVSVVLMESTGLLPFYCSQYNTEDGGVVPHFRLLSMNKTICNKYCK